MLNQSDAITIGNAVLSEVQNLSIPKIHKAVAAGGMDAGQLPAASDRSVLMPKVYRLFSELSHEAKVRAIPILAGQIFQSPQRRDDAQNLIHLLEQHGFQYVSGSVVPIGFLDERESRHLPQSAAVELSGAMDRLTREDLTGAITNACGAVDSTTTALMNKHGLGTAEAFSAKVNTVVNRLGVFDDLRTEMETMGLRPEDARAIAADLHEVTKKSADALAAMRRTMGDVHGRKKTTVQMVYSAVKLASALCGFLEGR
jgi:hypothetical protein